MNTEKLLTNLKTLSSKELDAIVELRQNGNFQNIWDDLGDLIEDLDSFPNEDEVIKSMLDATRNHQICYEIGDDFETPPFLKFLRNSYKQGIIPSKWEA